MEGKVRMVEYSKGHEIAIRTWERDRFGHHAPITQNSMRLSSTTESNASVALSCNALGIPLVEGPERYAIARALLRESNLEAGRQDGKAVKAEKKAAASKLFKANGQWNVDWDTDAHRKRAREYAQRERAKAKLEEAIQ